MGIELHPILLSLTDPRRYHRSESQLLPNVAKSLILAALSINLWDGDRTRIKREPIGVLLLLKSRYELVEEKDFSMAVVFAAMAFEGELSRLFVKWKEIEYIGAGTELDREACEEQLRDFRTINGKIEGVSQFLVGSGIDDFVSSKTQLREDVSKGFKSIRVGTLATDFQQHLFWPRNRVLHWGDAKNSYEGAARCYSIANLGLTILREMDLHRRAILEPPRP